MSMVVSTTTCHHRRLKIPGPLSLSTAIDLIDWVCVCPRFWSLPGSNRERCSARPRPHRWMPPRSWPPYWSGMGFPGPPGGLRGRQRRGARAREPPGLLRDPSRPARARPLGGPGGSHSLARRRGRARSLRPTARRPPADSRRFRLHQPHHGRRDGGVRRQLALVDGRLCTGGSSRRRRRRRSSSKDHRDLSRRNFPT